MKVVLLSGDFGSRILEESVSKPKPMIEIGIEWPVDRVGGWKNVITSA